MLKIVSIALPAELVQKIDEMLLGSGFGSRSDFFRHIARLWQLHGDADFIEAARLTGKSKKSCGSDLPKKGMTINKTSTELRGEFADVDCEFEIPPNVVDRIWEISKNIN